MFHWNTHQRVYVVYILYNVYTTAINDLRSLVGLICFSTEWKNNNIYICAYVPIYI